MKKVVLKLGIGVTTFVLSLVGVWMFNVSCEVVRTLQKGVPENPNLIKNVNSIKEETELRDITISRGCGKVLIVFPRTKKQIPFTPGNGGGKGTLLANPDTSPLMPKSIPQISKDKSKN